MSTTFDELDAFYQFATQLRDSNQESFSLDQAWKEFLEQRDWQPKTPLGKQLKLRRSQFIAEGGKLLTSAEIESELRERRGSLGDATLAD